MPRPLRFLFALALAAGPAAAQPAQGPLGDFPAALDRGTLTEWVKQRTDLTPASVVSVSPMNLMALTAIDRPEPYVRGRYRVQLQAEVINADAVAATGRSSWTAGAEVDCLERRIRLGAIREYSRRQLQGLARETPATEAWTYPAIGTNLHNVVRAVCDADYRRPLTAGPVEAAPPPPAPPATPYTPRLSQAEPSGPPGIAAVQVTASADEVSARAALGALRARFADQISGLSARVVRADVGGRTVYRALLSGFPTRERAQQLCRTLQASGQDCFLRPPGG